MTCLVAQVCAHGGLGNYTVGETWYRGYDPYTDPAEQDGQPWTVQRKWATIDPIFEVTSPYLSCNDPGTSPVSYIPINTGENITAVYWYWLHPYGPMTAWLARCTDPTGKTDIDCTEVKDTATLRWFKIWEASMVDGTLEGGMWYQKWFQRWDGEPGLWPVQIPESLKPGKYIIRHEILSIHVSKRPQLYPECAHLEISGTGSAMPEGEEWYLKFPGGYAEDDPQIFIDIYDPKYAETTNYTVHGGPVWTGPGIPYDKYCLGC